MKKPYVKPSVTTRPLAKAKPHTPDASGLEDSRLVIADRLKALREQKNMSQGDIEKRTGLRRCYISRVENGHTVPAIETLEKMARALEVPIYALFYDGEKPPAALPKPKTTTAGWAVRSRCADAWQVP